ncbi:hypothetical protein DPX16_1594 [Anabarilius grahami]|uniref:Uncharacterized protein n=1 Tax=Anabarilius grahami TaxID=495550 RepID=A0A3N0Z9T9_ANAGA|nr:hypothetical protein DPX16_1594 [Anabarilius grahami]
MCNDLRARPAPKLPPHTGRAGTLSLFLGSNNLIWSPRQHQNGQTTSSQNRILMLSVTTDAPSRLQEYSGFAACDPDVISRRSDAEDAQQTRRERNAPFSSSTVASLIRSSSVLTVRTPPGSGTVGYGRAASVRTPDPSRIVPEAPVPGVTDDSGDEEDFPLPVEERR